MDMKLNHSDLSALLAKEAGISVSKAETFTKAIFDVIIEGLESDGAVKINGFGTFKITDVASRSSVNVNTGEKFEIKGHRKLTFIPADSLKDDVNQPFAMFEPVEVDDTYSDDEPAEAAEETEDKEATEIEVQPEEIIVENKEAEIEVKEEEVVAEPESEPVLAEEAIEEEPVVVQERPAEPVMVHVPKKEKRTPVIEEKKSYKWLHVAFSISLFTLLALAALFYAYFSLATKETETAETTEAIVIPTEEKPVVADSTDAVTGATVDATTGATPQNQELGGEEKSVNDVASQQETEKKDAYEFVLVEKLMSIPLKDITLADTGMYEITGEWTRHKVAAGETLTRIALKYYGDKRLWPYIVKHNSMSRPDDLSKGMTVSIPKLEPMD